MDVIGKFAPSVANRVFPLKGFRKVWLEPGERRTVTITCPTEELEWYNENTGEFELEHMNYEIYIGTSSADKDLYKITLILVEEVSYA